MDAGRVSDMGTFLSAADVVPFGGYLFAP